MKLNPYHKDPNLSHRELEVHTLFEQVLVEPSHGSIGQACRQLGSRARCWTKSCIAHTATLRTISVQAILVLHMLAGETKIA